MHWHQHWWKTTEQASVPKGALVQLAFPREPSRGGKLALRMSIREGSWDGCLQYRRKGSRSRWRLKLDSAIGDLSRFLNGSARAPVAFRITLVWAKWLGLHNSVDHALGVGHPWKELSPWARQARWLRVTFQHRCRRVGVKCCIPDETSAGL